MSKKMKYLFTGFMACVLVCYSHAGPKKSDQEIARILGTAEALAHNLAGVDRAYAYLLVSHAYASFDPSEEKRLLKESCNAAISAPAEDLDVSFKEKIEYDCLQRLLVVMSGPANELLPSAGANVRQQILGAKAADFAKKGDVDAAMTLLSAEITRGADYPYDRAIVVMKALPKGDRADRDRIFAQALSIFRERHTRATAGMEDLGTLIVQSWRDLSPGLVLEAVNELLDSALNENVADSHLEVTVSLQSSARSFGSLYQYRLFQLLPVLRALDPSGAEKLVRDNQQLGLSQKPDAGPVLSMTLQRKDGPAGGTGAGNQTFGAIQLRLRAEQILASVKDAPSSALARALALDDNIDQNRSIKADLLTGIARATAKEHPELATDALAELSKVVEHYPLILRCRYLAEAGNLYWRMKKIDKVRDIVGQGMKLANELYKADTNSDDPNRALKSAWPSTVVSRAFVGLASRVSLKFAEEIVKEIPDYDLQVFGRIEMASTLLATSSYPSLMEQRHKQQNVYSMRVFAIFSANN
jgi:hypothetical protein